MFSNSFNDPKYYILLYNFYPIKTRKYLLDYFTTAKEIYLTKKIPLSVYFLKISVIIKMIEFIIVFFIPLSHNYRMYIFDYFYFAKVSKEFNLQFCFLLITVVTNINQLYFKDTNNDFIAILGQIIAEKKLGNFFIDSKTNGKNVKHYIQYVVDQLAKGCVVFHGATCKFLLDSFNMVILNIQQNLQI